MATEINPVRIRLKNTALAETIYPIQSHIDTQGKIRVLIVHGIDRPMVVDTTEGEVINLLPLQNLRRSVGRSTGKTIWHAYFPELAISRSTGGNLVFEDLEDINDYWGGYEVLNFSESLTDIPRLKTIWFMENTGLYANAVEIPPAYQEATHYIEHRALSGDSAIRLGYQWRNNGGNNWEFICTGEICPYVDEDALTLLRQRMGCAPKDVHVSDLGIDFYCGKVLDEADIMQLDEFLPTQDVTVSHEVFSAEDIYAKPNFEGEETIVQIALKDDTEPKTYARMRDVNHYRLTSNMMVANWFSKRFPGVVLDYSYVNEAIWTIQDDLGLVRRSVAPYRKELEDLMMCGKLVDPKTRRMYRSSPNLLQRVEVYRDQALMGFENKDDANCRMGVGFIAGTTIDTCHASRALRYTKAEAVVPTPEAATTK